MKTRIFAAILLFVLFSSAHASSYRAEVDVSMYRFNFEEFGNDSVYYLDGTYYFSPVQTTGHPLAEAAFLERSSGVGLSVSHDFESITAWGEFYFPSVKLFVAPMVHRIDDDWESDTELSLALGFNPFSGLVVGTVVTDDGYDPNIFAKYTLPIGSHFLGLQGGYEDYDDGDRLMLAADYYPNRRLSVGLGYVEVGDEDAIMVRSRMFFTDRISANLSYFDYDWAQVIIAGLSVRF